MLGTATATASTAGSASGAMSGATLGVETQKKFRLICHRCNAKFKDVDPEQRFCLRHRSPLKGGMGEEFMVNKASKSTKNKKPVKGLPKIKNDTQEGDPPVSPSHSPDQQARQISQHDLQATVNEMMWQHGVNLAQRGDYPDLLKQANLKVEEVSKKVLEKAEQYFKSRVKEESQKPQPESDSKVTWPLEPQQEDTRTSKVLFWASKCGRYRAYQIKDKSTQEVSYISQYRTPNKDWIHCAHVKDLGPGYPKYIYTLEAAFLQAEKFHSERAAIVCLHTNREEALAKAIELGIISKTPPPIPKTERRLREPSQPREPRAPREPRQPRQPGEAGAGRDEWGTRIGSQAWHINQALTLEPQTIKDLADASGQTTARVQGHVKHLLGLGFIVQNGSRYARILDTSKDTQEEKET